MQVCCLSIRFVDFTAFENTSCLCFLIASKVNNHRFPHTLDCLCERNSKNTETEVVLVACALKTKPFLAFKVKHLVVAHLRLKKRCMFVFLNKWLLLISVSNTKMMSFAWFYWVKKTKQLNLFVFTWQDKAGSLLNQVSSTIYVVFCLNVFFLNQKVQIMCMSH